MVQVLVTRPVHITLFGFALTLGGRKWPISYSTLNLFLFCFHTWNASFQLLNCGSYLLHYKGYQTCKTWIKIIKSGFKCGKFHILLKVLYFVTTRKYPLVYKQRLQVAIIYLRYGRACSARGSWPSISTHAFIFCFPYYPWGKWGTARSQSSVNISWPFDEGKNMVTWEFIKRSFLRQFKGDYWQILSLV